MIDLTDKNVVITGSTSGVGQEAAIKLANMGASLLLVARSKEKALQTMGKIRKKSRNTNVDYVLADLSSQVDVRKVSKEISTKLDHVDVLMNNAGAYYSKRYESVDGLELTFAINHLNYFLLTHQLMDLLNQSPSPRIINVSSSAHYGREITFDDLNRNENYSGFRVYGETKLANVMFTYSLARKVKSTMTVNALHPSFVATGFASNNGFLYKIGMILMRPLQMSTKKGAKTQIYLASSPKVDNTTGKFFIKKKERSSSRYSNEKEHQKRLWDISEELTNL